MIIASDCKGVVNDIKEGTGGQYASIIKEIKATSRQFARCSFIFEGRDTNIEVHSFTKDALRLSLGCHVWLLNTPDLD